MTITTSELATRLGRSAAAVRNWCNRAGWPRKGRDWLLDEDQAAWIAAHIHDRRGRPRRGPHPS